MKKYWILLLVFFVGLIWSGIHPRNQWLWFGEVLPNIIGLIIIGVMFPKFRFSYFTLVFILVACWLIYIGGHFTFSRVPYFKELGQYFGFERNNFDKLGHFFQGVIPALVARELFIRKKLMQRNWIGFIAFCLSLTTAAVYEIIEFLMCVIVGKNLETFTGSQGYVWDSQTDMLAAMLGGLFVVFILKPAHDRAMKREFPREFIA